MENHQNNSNPYDIKIARYEECSQLLKDLDRNNDVTVGLVSQLSGGKQYSEYTVEELISIGAARRGENGNLVRTDSTHSLNAREYFEERINELSRQKKLEELNSQSVMSSEKSAKAAETSATSAKYANLLSLLTIIVSLLVSIFYCAK